MRQSSKLVLAVLVLASCGAPSEPSPTGPSGAGGESGASASTGGAGSPAGGTQSGGAVSQIGGAASGGELGAGGTGGTPWYLTGGSGGATDPPTLSDDPEVATWMASQDTACRAACTNALVCQPVHETIDNCLNVFLCLHMEDRVDNSPAPRQTVIDCLRAATDHMNCVAALDCSSYAVWWNESASPFPCEPEQRAEEQACAGALIF